MASDGRKLKEVRLTTPVPAEAIQGLALGDVVYLDGLIATGREGVYRRILDEGAAPPIDLKATTATALTSAPLPR